jgi:hypothetical protein
LDDPGPCLSCALPDCDEDSPGCRRRQVRQPSKWQDEIDLVAGLCQGQRLALDPVPRTCVRSLQDALRRAARSGWFGFPIRTRSHHITEELTEVEVWRSDQVTGRHWSRWAEDIDRLFALQECSYVLSTPVELCRLQNAIYRRAARAGVLVETWRAHRDGHLVLHARWIVR